MDEWFGLQPTGRQLKEPTGQLVELVDDEGLVYLGLQFDPIWAEHPVWQRQVSLVQSFLEYPMVVGLVELVRGDPEAGRFVYPTGPVLTVKEILRAHSDLGHTLGARATLELMYLAGQILTEGAATGGMQGCFSHTGLSPWRLTVRDDAHVQVIGYGLPQIDVLVWRGAPDRLPSADSVRYAPPERLSGHAEDEAADTASLVILGYELLTGQPLYAGHDPVEIARSAAISEAVPMLSRPNALPRDIAQVFARSLVFDPDSRLRGADWLAEIAGLLEAHSEGDGLDAAVGRVRGTGIEGTRRARIRQTTETSSFTPQQLASLTKDPAAPAASPATPRPARWQKVDRSQQPTPSGPGAAAPRDPQHPTRRRRQDGPSRPLSVDEEERSADDLPLLDLDNIDDDDDDLALDPHESAPPRARLRRRADTANVPRPLPQGPPAPAGPAADAADAPTSSVPGRRRRRHDA